MWHVPRNIDYLTLYVVDVQEVRHFHLISLVFSEEFACTGKVMTRKRTIGSGQSRSFCVSEGYLNQLFLQMLLAGYQTFFRVRSDRDPGHGVAEEQVHRREPDASGIQVGTSRQSRYFSIPLHCSYSFHENSMEIRHSSVSF